MLYVDMVSGRPNGLVIDSVNCIRAISELKTLIQASEAVEGSRHMGGAGILAPFCGRIIEEDIPVLYWYQYKATISRLKKILADLDVRQSTLESVVDGVDPLPVDEVEEDEETLLSDEITLSSLRRSELASRLQSDYGLVVSSFKASMFLREIDSSGLHQTLQPRTYLSIHPLIPILVCASESYKSSWLSMIEGFYTYMTKRMQRWRWVRPYSTFQTGGKQSFLGRSKRLPRLP